MNTMYSMISVMVCSVPHVKRFCVLFDCLYRVGYSRLARLYVWLRSGQLFIFYAVTSYSRMSSIRLMTHSFQT